MVLLQTKHKLQLGLCVCATKMRLGLLYARNARCPALPCPAWGSGRWQSAGSAEGMKGGGNGGGMRLHKFLVLCCILLGVIYDFDAHLCGNTTNQNENAIANGNPNEHKRRVK